MTILHILHEKSRQRDKNVYIWIFGKGAHWFFMKINKCSTNISSYFPYLHFQKNNKDSGVSWVTF